MGLNAGHIQRRRAVAFEVAATSSAYTHTHTHAHTHNARTRRHARTRAHARTCCNTQTHKHTHTHTQHTHTQTHTHTHTQRERDTIEHATVYTVLPVVADTQVGCSWPMPGAVVPEHTVAPARLPNVLRAMIQVSYPSQTIVVCLGG